MMMRAWTMGGFLAASLCLGAFDSHETRSSRSTESRSVLSRAGIPLAGEAARAPAAALRGVSPMHPAARTGDFIATALSCVVCHPGALASLSRGPHKDLVKEHGRDGSCMQCHSDAEQHQAAPNNKTSLPGPAINSCVSCHADYDAKAKGAELDARRVSHPSKAEARALARSLRIAAEGPALIDPQRGATQRAGLELSGLLRAGWRFVDVDGDKRAFDHDWQLDAGPRLLALELGAMRGGKTVVDASAEGLEDREFNARIKSGKGLHEALELRGKFQRSIYVYDAEGDYHTLSRARTRSEGAIGWDFGARSLSFEFERYQVEGRTITSRVGNANQTPLDPATAVPSDLRLTSDVYRLVLEERPEWGVLSLELGWEEMRRRDELSYSRPSPVNPPFTERETSAGRYSERGPEASVRAVFGRDGDSSRLELLARGVWHDVRALESGRLEAFDTSAFTTDSTGTGIGDRRRLAIVARGQIEVGEDSRLLFDASAHDVRDHYDFSSRDVTTRVAPPSTTVLTTQQDFLTRVRDREARLAWEQTFGAVVAEFGYSYLEQYLQVPDFEAFDADFRAGTVREQGPDLALEWRPDDLWSARLSYSWIGTQDRTPTETQPEHGQRIRGRLRRQLDGGQGSLEVFANWWRAENDVSSTQVDQQRYGVALSSVPWDEARLVARVAWSQIRSETWTNFYFGTVTPVPRFVRFRGDSISADLSLETKVAGALSSFTSFGFQHTDGSLDSTLARFDEELVWRQAEDLSIGLRLSVFHFDEARGTNDDDYNARVALLFAELRW